jgi:hypothetical protein
MDVETTARSRQFSSKFAALNISMPGASALIANYSRGVLPPIHIVIEDLLSITSDDMLPRERLQVFCAICSPLALNPQSIGGQVESVFFRVATFLVSSVTSQKCEVSELADALCFLCCNLLAHLLQEEGTFSDHSSQSSLQLLLNFILECMSNSHFAAPFNLAFGSKGFGSLLAVCEECTAHVLSVDIASETGSSMLEYMWSIYLLVASVFASSAAHDNVDASHFQNFVCQVSNAMIITKDYLQLFRRTNDLAGVASKIASVVFMRPQPNVISSFFVQCFDIVCRLRTLYLSRGQVDLLLCYLDCVAAVAEYSRCSCCAASASGDVRSREGTALIEDALRTSTFDTDEILPVSCFDGADAVVARWIADDLAFCSFVTEHFHEKIMSKCAPTLELLRRHSALDFEQFQGLWTKAVNCSCDSINILKTKFPEISHCLLILDHAFALRIIESCVAAFASDSSPDIRVHHLKSLHIVAHFRNIGVMNAVLNALWDCVCCRCHSSVNLEDILEILHNARAQFCLAEFHLSHSMTLIPRLFSTLANPDSAIEAIFACQVLYLFIDSDACVSMSASSFECALVDTVNLFNSVCIRPVGPSSYSSSTLSDFFMWICQLMLTIVSRLDALLSTELLSSCFQSVVSPQFLYDDCLKVELFSLLVQVSLHHDSIQTALLDSVFSRHLVDVVVIVLSFLEHVSTPAVSDCLQYVNNSVQILPLAMKMQIYLRCMQSAVLDHLWKICFQQLNENLLSLFADIVAVASDPRVSTPSSDLLSGVSKILASKIDSIISKDVPDEISRLLHIIKFALNRQPSTCCFGSLALVSPPVLICFPKEQPVKFQMATSFRSIQSALCIEPCKMTVCDEALEDAASLALSVGFFVEQIHDQTIPDCLNVSVEAPHIDSPEPVPLSLLPQILGPKFRSWLHTLVFSDFKHIQSIALDLCCLLPSFDDSLRIYLNPTIMDKIRIMVSPECKADVDSHQIFFSCYYACGIMAATTCNIGGVYDVFELSDEDVLFCCDFLSYCLLQLEGKPSAVWNRIYLVGMLSSLHSLSNCSKHQFPAHFCTILLNLQKLLSVAGFPPEAHISNTCVNCPVGHVSLCRGIIRVCVNVAARASSKHLLPVFSHVLSITLTSMPSSLLHAAYDSVASLIKADSNSDVLDSVISSSLAVPLVCRTAEFSRAYTIYSRVISFLSRRPDLLNGSTRVNLLVSACVAIDSIDWSYCHSIRNGQTLISQFLHMCVLMLKIASDNARVFKGLPASVVEIVVKSFKSISCFVTADGGSCGLASFRGDASTLSQSAQVSLSQLFSRIVDFYSSFVPVDEILSVLAKNHQM